ncbi:4-hydroxy-2-oxoheptanedioate aldolase [Aureimonas fodinaquatilis]|uniref:4-hydroxy-2-oxoheptanedioate aldolase n=1 Tax=Aureimonas fodinaquatilis TaxID=2565783 RepID=A0A5B0DSH7_9HYPH|nr:4-hydroxy-2-oxoheptanedioate aldolase [Aureimonas fodinaquatilis]KAA0969764.1 4-hydroxy-2-oxoheptanedioate aldolase [Aureimonas fodinaquatilis]
MPAPRNTFKEALANRRRQIGLWLGLADSYSAGLLAGTGFDWLVIDGEHSPNDLRSMLGQLQAIAPSATAPVIRLPIGETWMIKQALDIGCQTILVPMVETAEHATALAKAMRYPPQGTRGVGAALARASGFNAIPDYLHTANDEVCLLVQVESVAGLSAIDAISAVDGVDGIFVGPADLAADMGLRGQADHPDVQEAISSALQRIHAAGKPSGILTSNQTLARHYIDFGATFVAVGSDIGLLRQAAASLRAAFD